ncbi:MAG: efflux RND transporter periplasmic adaptor subunit [Candidatus Binatia bacterium]
MLTPWKISTCLALVPVLLAGCQEKSPPAENGHAEQSISITEWTHNTELFVEFSSLIVGKETPFAVHLTDLNTFQPVSADTLITTLESPDGQNITVRTGTPIVPGIYRPVVTPDRPGTYRLIFQRAHPQSQAIHDTIVAGEVEVVVKKEHSPQEKEEPQGQGITFLKEQQWRIEFATEGVAQKELAATLKLHAEVKPTAGGEVHIAAPLGGRVLAVEKGVPVLGQRVEPGESLALILPLHSSTTNRTELESAVKTAQAELEAVEQELRRVQDLYKDRIVPKRRLEQAQKEVAVLQARLIAARSQLSLLNTNQALDVKTLPSALEKFFLRSPIAGTVVATHMTPGALVETGQDLFTIMDLEHVWIEGRLFEPDIPKVRAVERARFAAPALSEPLALSPPQAHLVTIGSVLDRTTRSVPLILTAKNPAGQLKVGMHGELIIPTGETIQDLAVPVSAVVDDKGIPIAFVQTEGEKFERRELELGIQSDGYTQVKSGLAAGERVVTKGAYRVHLASLSTELPAHGHAH